MHILADARTTLMAHVKSGRTGKSSDLILVLSTYSSFIYTGLIIGQASPLHRIWRRLNNDQPCTPPRTSMGALTNQAP